MLLTILLYFINCFNFFIIFEKYFVNYFNINNPCPPHTHTLLVHFKHYKLNVISVQPKKKVRHNSKKHKGKH